LEPEHVSLALAHRAGRSFAELCMPYDVTAPDAVTAVSSRQCTWVHSLRLQICAYGYSGCLRLTIVTIGPAVSVLRRRGVCVFAQSRLRGMVRSPLVSGRGLIMKSRPPESESLPTWALGLIVGGVCLILSKYKICMQCKNCPHPATRPGLHSSGHCR
jgi:hypothetical protein